MKYNIYFELAALAFLVVFNIYIRLQYNSKPLTNRRFKLLSLSMFAALLLDIVTAVSISYARYIPVWLNMSLNFLYLCSDIVLEYLFVTYCMLCVYEEDKPVVLRVSRVIVFLSAALLVVNFWTGWVFSFTDEGYVHGPVYFLVHAVPFIAIVASIVILFLGFGKFNKSQRVSVVIYSVVAFVGPLVQLFFPNVLFTLFAVALGFIMLMFSLETPDYQALNRTMEELRRARDEANEAYAAAQASSRAKSKFLSSMSHEIRTPINAILGYAETITREADGGISGYSSIITASGKRLLNMVNDIMFYTEMESGDFVLEKLDYQTSSFLMDVITSGEYYTENKGIELRLNIDEKIPSGMHGDCARLTQVFDNLLSNAAKYTDSGYVELGISYEDMGGKKGVLSAYIRDTGLGMREEEAAAISSVFLRMDREHNYNKQGLGLGLAIVTRLLSMMDSSLKVETEYGKGTVMSFSVVQGVYDPTPVGSMEREAPQAVEAEEFCAPDARVLAVDDNDINLDLLSRNLRDTKAVIDTASNGAEAIELIKANSYDIIFLDHMMPVMDGLEAMRKIKADELCPGVPIVVVTANAVSGEREMYLSEGFDEYLSKPVTRSRLLRVMKKFLPPHLIVESEKSGSDERTDTDGGTEENAQSVPSGVMKELSFLNTEMGLAYCCDSEEFYLQILAAYVEGDKTEGILKAYEENDTDNFRILVHGLKGTSLSIGAEAFSEQARLLEMAARENDPDYIKENVHRVLEEYRVLLDRIRQVVGVPA